MSVLIKTENKSSDNCDGENIFNFQEEFVENVNYQSEDTKYLTNSSTMATEDDPLNSNEKLTDIPKIHLKTVDEINRKCIVSNYMDIVKKRRREVNRRYYLKRKEKMGKQHTNMDHLSEENQDKKELEQASFQNSSLTSSDDQNIQSMEEPTSQLEKIEHKPIKVENSDSVVVDPVVPCHNSSVGNHYSTMFVSDNSSSEYPEDPVVREHMFVAWKTYIDKSRQIRKAINRRYYLKRKRKIQLEKGITDRVIIKNEAYMKKRERNRRYYLKKKQRMKENDQHVEDSSVSQASWELSNYESNSINEIKNNNQTTDEITNFESKYHGIDNENDSYSFPVDGPQTEMDIKHENQVKDTNSFDNYEEPNEYLYSDSVVEKWNIDHETSCQSTNNFYSDSNNFMKVNNDSGENNFMETVPEYNTSTLLVYSGEAARKRQERNRRYYLKHKEKLKQQRRKKC